MMAFRVVCFVGAVVLFTRGAGWLAAVPAVGAIVIPYFAVVFANGGREPSSTKGFRAYEPNLPARYRPPGTEQDDREQDDREQDDPTGARGQGGNGHAAPPHWHGIG
jgi:DUF3099 family protein